MSSVGSLQLAIGSLSINGFSASSLMGTGVAQPSSFPLGCSSNSCNLITMMSLKRWERQEVKPNSLPLVRKMHVKTGDTVKVISGADKGKIGEITKLYTHNSKVLIKDVNIKTKHVKGKQEGETGQIVQVEAPIHSSNVMLYSKKEKLTSRVGHKIMEDGRKVRYLLKTGELLDSLEEWKKLHKNKKKERSN